MTFQTFTGKDYLKIDIANNFGLDKKEFDERLAWFDQNEHRLGALVKQAEEPALFYAGCVAWEKTKQGKPSGYPISLDATCSGIQILACLAGDRSAAALCNVVDTGRREDAYVSIYRSMVERLGEGAKIDRKQTKQAIMTSFYGSTAVPKNVFGEGQLLETFYKTMQELAPGAWEINEVMLAIWDNQALVNSWTMPDGFEVVIKVMGQVKETVHFRNEPFEVIHSENMPIDGGRSLGANMTHSIDGMLVRELVRRCDYDLGHLQNVWDWHSRGVMTHGRNRNKDRLLLRLWELAKDSGFFSARILDLLDADNFGLIPHKEIGRLLDSLPRRPFKVLTVHDCFRCLPNYGNDLRQQYNNLLAELAESEMLSFLTSQMTGTFMQIAKLDPSLGKDVRNSNYALS